jgi:hypothetical protein
MIKTSPKNMATDQSIDEKMCNISGGILETNTVIENECDHEYNRYLMLTNEASA